MELYKVLPIGCLYDTRGGPIEGTIIKALHYTPEDLVAHVPCTTELGGQYIYDDCCDVDTYIGPSGTGEHHYLFKREKYYPVFHETFELGSLLRNGVGG